MEPKDPTSAASSAGRTSGTTPGAGSTINTGSSSTPAGAAAGSTFGGATSGDAPHAASSSPTGGSDLGADLSDTFDKAKKDLGDAIGRLKSEAQKFDADDAGAQARGWIEENPTLAFALAVGGGLLVGRLLGGALAPEPPTFKRRAEKMAKRYAKEAGRAVRHARSAADDAGDTLVDRASAAGSVISASAAAAAALAARKAKRFGGAAADRASSWGEHAADRASSLSEEAGDRASSWKEQAADYAEALGERIGDGTQDARKAARKATKKARREAGHGLDVAGGALHAAQTAVAAVVAKKLMDLVKQFR